MRILDTIEMVLDFSLMVLNTTDTKDTTDISDVSDIFARVQKDQDFNFRLLVYQANRP